MTMTPSCIPGLLSRTTMHSRSTHVTATWTLRQENPDFWTLNPGHFRLSISDIPMTPSLTSHATLPFPSPPLPCPQSERLMLTFPRWLSISSVSRSSERVPTTSPAPSSPCWSLPSSRCFTSSGSPLPLVRVLSVEEPTSLPVPLSSPSSS